MGSGAPSATAAALPVQAAGRPVQPPTSQHCRHTAHTATSRPRSAALRSWPLARVDAVARAEGIVMDGLLSGLNGGPPTVGPVAMAEALKARGWSCSSCSCDSLGGAGVSLSLCLSEALKAGLGRRGTGHRALGTAGLARGGTRVLVERCDCRRRTTRFAARVPAPRACHSRAAPPPPLHAPPLHAPSHCAACAAQAVKEGMGISDLRITPELAPHGRAAPARCAAGAGRSCRAADTHQGACAFGMGREAPACTSRACRVGVQGAGAGGRRWRGRRAGLPGEAGK
jgi:hypothetical protein